MLNCTHDLQSVTTNTMQNPTGQITQNGHKVVPKDRIIPAHEYSSGSAKNEIRLFK